ncbi:PREDICTED: probable disease resistance protein RPP1 [Prunus mume]|uniref:Probable disease resistance protein RPP1 n=1 Tax=Prunus mume TaxID=102107 RepID=A0ABM1LTC5_PRUMU|nr:PREDICTED: probable disease resistance protein RPP1 [Prunus mume]
MPYSQVVGQLWNEDQSPPVNLKWINLEGCMYLTKVPDLSRSLQIKHIDLKRCGRLVEIPSYFQHLGKLTYLDLGQCTNLKNLPEMPCNLEFLNLSSTAIEELPSSVWSHEKISHLDIRYCGHFKSLPSNTCKLKLSLGLDYCNSLCEFWELPRDTTQLQLSYSTIKELRNASIESVIGLTAIELHRCESLVSLPTNIWKLKSLKSLNLEDCSNFQNFPEISEVMEYLEFLNLSGTAVKEIPPSIRNLVVLRELDLHNCKNLEVVPDELFCLTSLQVLDLKGTEIKSLPASIKQAAQLSLLFLNNCKSLESLPELPPLLQCLEAEGCTSLKTVSSSSTALAQGWEKYKFSRGLIEKHTFFDCIRLDENARSNIMGDAQLRIMRMATESSKFKEDKIEKASYNSNKESVVGIRCGGNEIPKWFSHRSEGCSIKIELPRDWVSTDFLGFALSLVVSCQEDYYDIWYLISGCKYNFKTSNGESHAVDHLLRHPPPENRLPIGDPHEVWMWWHSSVFEEVVQGAQSPTAFYKLVTELNVDFIVRDDCYGPHLIEKCGICLLYGKDVEKMIKQRAL